ncbi:hypothetical protein OsI_22255 [Oryza sativa Indica Group]|uniref:Uncharacterized protein n=1 Tax=Oryza sativa subsp. indica TaxID=39946 RepID=B8B496_ORYSI|nr:hypothetical protein OsI_22255 [Oryza sativa Indica Group]
MGAGMNLPMLPLMPWQRQMGAISTSDLKPSQQTLGGAGTSVLVAYSTHGISAISDDKHSVGCGVIGAATASALWELLGTCTGAPDDPGVMETDGSSGGNGGSSGIWIVGSGCSCGSPGIWIVGSGCNGGRHGIWIVGSGGNGGRPGIWIVCSGGRPGNPTSEADSWDTSALAF